MLTCLSPLRPTSIRHWKSMWHSICYRKHVIIEALSQSNEGNGHSHIYIHTCCLALCKHTLVDPANNWQAPTIYAHTNTLIHGRTNERTADTNINTHRSKAGQWQHIGGGSDFRLTFVFTVLPTMMPMPPAHRELVVVIFWVCKRDQLIRPPFFNFFPITLLPTERERERKIEDTRFKIVVLLY